MSVTYIIILLALLLIAVWRELEVQNLRRQNEALQKELADIRQTLATSKHSATVR
jgi:hypothetical protein